MAGRLVICPTPIGNLGDMTLRTLEELRDADAVCAEDTRVTGKLLAHFGIEKRLERLDEAAISHQAGRVAERVAAGETVAFCSDAGMPGVSDSGARLIEAVRAAGGHVDVLPGASAAVTAYVASGFNNPRFFFGGFFSAKRCRTSRDTACSFVARCGAHVLRKSASHRFRSFRGCRGDAEKGGRGLPGAYQGA